MKLKLLSTFQTERPSPQGPEAHWSAPHLWRALCNFLLSLFGRQKQKECALAHLRGLCFPHSKTRQTYGKQKPQLTDSHGEKANASQQCRKGSTHDQRRLSRRKTAPMPGIWGLSSTAEGKEENQSDMSVTIKNMQWGVLLADTCQGVPLTTYAIQQTWCKRGFLGEGRRVGTCGGGERHTSGHADRQTEGEEKGGGESWVAGSPFISSKHRVRPQREAWQVMT